MAFSGAGRPEQALLNVVESRLGPPRLRTGTIERGELVNRLRTAPDGVALVVAPAGYGKTTLVADFFRRPGMQPVAWLSVDEHDNDPITLLTYLTLTLNRIGVCDRRFVEALAKPRSSLSTMLARLHRSLEAACRRQLVDQ